MNITVAEMGTGGNLRLWPAGAPQPTVSTINWTGATFVIANAAIVPLGGGAITVRNDSTGPTQLIIDVNGYYYQYNSGTALNNNYFAIANNMAGWAAILGVNSNSGAGTLGVWGYVSGSGTGTSGVSGTAVSGSGVTYGVKGTTSSNTATAAGVFGEAGGVDTYGVIGHQNASSGKSAGVRGYTGTGIQNDTWSISGVRGEGTNFGVLGVSTSLGTGGFRHAADGSLQTGSYLGFSSTNGLHTIGTTSATGAKAFVEPHPVDANLVIKYVALEGNEAGTYFRGRGRFSGGAAVISVPEDFRMVSDAEGLSIQVTPIGDFANVAVVSLDLDKVVLKGSRNVEFFYTVNGLRRAYRDFQPIQEGREYVPMSPDQKMPSSYPAEIRQRLIDNGTFGPDEKVNMETAIRLGWTKDWQDRQTPEAAPQE